MKYPIIADCIEFIRVEDKILRSWTDKEIEIAIAKAIDTNSLVFSVGNDSKVNGICFGIPHSDRKELHIQAVLTKEPWIFATFVKQFLAWYSPDWKITAIRKKTHKTVVYDPHKLFNKLCKRLTM